MGLHPHFLVFAGAGRASKGESWGRVPEGVFLVSVMRNQNFSSVNSKSMLGSSFYLHSSGSCPCPWQWGWNEMILKFPLNPNHSMSLQWFAREVAPPCDIFPSLGWPWLYFSCRSLLLNQTRPSLQGGKSQLVQQRWRNKGFRCIGGVMYQVSANKLSKTSSSPLRARDLSTKTPIRAGEQEFVPVHVQNMLSSGFSYLFPACGLRLILWPRRIPDVKVVDIPWCQVLFLLYSSSEGEIMLEKLKV